MTKFPRTPATIGLHKLLVTLCIGSITLAGCSDGDKIKATTPTPSTPTKAAPSPSNYSSAHIKANLISPNEIADRMREIEVALDGLKDNKVPLCSLSGVELPGDPDITKRQFSRQATPPGDVKYAQLVARYNSPQEAATAFQSLQQKARSCPKKRHVPPKRTDRDTITSSHDDTWKVEEGTVAGWQHLRGYERQVVPPSRTQYNIFFLMYDYAVRGNTLLSTLYTERTKPGKSGDPIAGRATEVLTKQLQKFG